MIKENLSLIIGRRKANCFEENNELLRMEMSHKEKALNQGMSGSSFD